MTTVDIEHSKQQARALLDSRIKSVTALVKARQRVSDIKRQSAEAGWEDNLAIVYVHKDGWTQDELKTLGLDNGAAGKRCARRSNSVWES